MKEERTNYDIRKKNGSEDEPLDIWGAARYAALNAQRERLGLAYGLLAALTYALVTWGLDAFLLARAHADLPWLKFLVGALFCAGLGGLVGWLAEKIDQALVTFLFWLATGIAFAWFASHLPFEILSAILGSLFPGLRGLAVYPYPPNVDSIMVVIYIVVGLCAGLVGALQNNLVESARGAVYPASRWLALGACIPLMLLAGNSADNINEPLRNALIGVDQVIENALRTEGTPVDKKTAAELRLRAVEKVKHLLHRPRRLILGSYDLDSLDSFGVYVDFDGVWATCSVLIETPSNCLPSDDLYPAYLKCLLDPEARTDPQRRSACQVSAAAAAREWLETHTGALGRSPLAQVYNQRGDVTLLNVLGEDRALYGCRFSGIQFTGVLRACALVEEHGEAAAFRPTATATLPKPTSTAKPTASAPVEEQTASLPAPAAPTQTETLPEPGAASTLEPGEGAEPAVSRGDASQEKALIPAARPDLESLADLTRYAIQVEIDFAGRTFQGRSRVVFTNTETVSLDRLYFRLLPNGGGSYGNGSLAVSGVAQDGQPLTTALSLADTVLEARLAAPLEPGERSQIELDFAGKVPSNFGETGYGIYNYTDGVMALADWYPLLAVYDEAGWNLDPVSSIGDSVYADMAFYTVEVTMNARLAAAATGVEVDRSTGEDQANVRFTSGPAREFFLALSDRFQVASQVVGGTTVSSYYLPDHAAAGREALKVAAAALKAYNKRFGQYPYAELDVVETPLNYAAGVEYPGLVLITESLYESRRQPFFTVVVAHEVGHQWWYNLVGNDVFEHPWLDEGLTTYSAALYYEETSGPGGYQATIKAYQEGYDRIVQEGQDDLVTESLSYYESTAGAGAYGAVVYEKSALFFHYLREAIGEEAFFEGLQAYYKEFKYRIAVPEDLLRAFEQAAGRELDDIYEEWLYTKK